MATPRLIDHGQINHQTEVVSFMPLAHRVRRRLFAMDPIEASFARRGFPATSQDKRERLERIGREFLSGYNAAVTVGDADRIAAELDATDSAFAYEGAAMGLALLDIVTPGKGRRLVRFIEGPGARHIYMAYVGAGWALARTSPRLAWRLGPLDPLLRWLMIDGYGFHEGYFHAERMIEGQMRPSFMTGHRAAVFDQGLGRSLWFVCGASADAVIETIGTFPAQRRPYLWAGVGLAASYAGGADDVALRLLVLAAGPNRIHLAQGAAFAAQARIRAGNPAAQTERAARIFCHMDAAEAASMTERALPVSISDDRGEGYDQWRADIRRLIEQKFRGDRE